MENLEGVSAAEKPSRWLETNDKHSEIKWYDHTPSGTVDSKYETLKIDVPKTYFNTEYGITDLSF